MRPILVACMAAGALLTRSTSADAQRTLIRAGRLLHPVTGRVSRDQVIVVERGRVTAVGSGFGPRQATASSTFPP